MLRTFWLDTGKVKWYVSVAGIVWTIAKPPNTRRVKDMHSFMYGAGETTYEQRVRIQRTKHDATKREAAKLGF